MSKPRRIQLSRRKGFKLPENTIVVSRPSRWGNPYKFDHYDVTSFPKSEQAHVLRGLATRDHWMWLRVMPEGEAVAERARIELCGRNLACWCPLPKRGEIDECHAANLIDVANDGAIVIRPVTPRNSSVLGYKSAAWIKRWWHVNAIWERAKPSADLDRSIHKTATVGSCATLHVPCTDHNGRDDGAVYRVRSRVQVGDKLAGKRVVRSWAERVDGVWCWIYEVGNV